uniref:Protein arginine methyltransferase NDUFAF7 n=1 Tax=Meloidogyne enterolobii TaxID=390850 RepID=A0A6V7YBU6_MELEN|nr:unnamed protein product [Meloidogyne enterolobii]
MFAPQFRPLTLKKFEKNIFRFFQNFQSINFSSASSSKKFNFESENVLERFIIDRIRSTGPISVSEYMKLCVSSQYGYYAQKAKIFGDGEGDFITSPELTQVFGELIGAWLLNELHMTGWEGPWNLVELGPGSGALMVDVLNVLNKLKSDNKLNVYLIEKSAQLIKQQKQIFEQQLLNKQISINWFDSIEDIPEGFTIFISNEFFDALPIHQFVRNKEKPNIWQEVYIQLTTSNGNVEIDEEDGQILTEKHLCFGLSPGENIHTRAYIPQHIRNDLSRTKWEYSPLATKITLEMIKKFTTNGGFALIIDYGHNGDRKTHSLRAYSNHSIVDPLDCPGRVDLTADVDFGEIKRVIEGKCLIFGPVEQRQFLTQLGLIHRLDYLLRKSTTTEQREALLNSCNILVSDAEMGARFKVFSLFPNTLSEIIKARGGIPAGFASPLPHLEDEDLIND